MSTNDNFTFHGDTTFINKPADTVISDFQNRYGSGDGAPDSEVNGRLLELVRILLSSQELSDRDREAAVVAVHAAAEQIETGEDPRETVAETLRGVERIVTRASDIVRPATAAVTAVSRLLGVG